MVTTVGQLPGAAPEEVQSPRSLTQNLVSKSQRSNIRWEARLEGTFQGASIGEVTKEPSEEPLACEPMLRGFLSLACSPLSIPTLVAYGPCHGLSPTSGPVSLLQVPLRQDSCLGLALWVVLKASFPKVQITCQGHWVKKCNTATTGLLCARSLAVSSGFNKNKFTHAFPQPPRG